MHEETLRIEAPCHEDIEDVGRLFYEDMCELGMEVTPEDMHSLATKVIEDSLSEVPDALIRVARLEEGTPVVGLILANFNWSLKFAGRALWIEALYVSAAGRRKGIGRKLVETLLDWAEAHEITGVDIEAYRGNTPAGVLYRSLGFHRLGRERFYYRIGAEEFL